ncbi:MAG TPA: endonuclease III [bacterium]|nr:endonuclease III [bacterium]HPN42436.1 endonuclease III [bacterium]
MHSNLVQQITTQLETAFGIPRRQEPGKPLDSLILTILSQSTNDRNRDAAYRQLVEQFPDWETLMNAPVEQVARAIRTAGLSNQKSARIQEALRWIYSTYHTFDLAFLCDMEPQQVIDTFMQLKGVGIKTISVVLMVTCGVDIFPVDTHVHRICKRLGLVPEKAGAEKTHHLMQPLVPKGKAYSLHMNFLKLGRTICKAQKPACRLCPISNLCPSAKME